MSIICDLCKKTLVIDEPSIEIPVIAEKVKKNLCVTCIKTCINIMKDPDVKDEPLVYLNEWRDKHGI